MTRTNNKVAFSTVGFGDITPTNDSERLCALALALMGALVFAYCVGSISSLFAEGSTTEAAIDTALREAHDFLTFRFLVDKQTEQRVKKHVLYASKIAPHLVQPSWGDLLPRKQRGIIIDKLMWEKMSMSKILRSLDLDCRAFVATYLRPTFLTAGQSLFSALDVAMEMYFVTAGECEALDQNAKHVLYTFKPGDHFGDIALFPELCPVRTSTVRAKTDVEALELGSSDLHANIKPYFPDFFQALKDLATTRMYWLETRELTKALAQRSLARCSFLKQETRNLNKSKIQVMRDMQYDPSLTTLEYNRREKEGVQNQEHEGALGKDRALSQANELSLKGVHDLRGSFSLQNRGRRGSEGSLSRLFGHGTARRDRSASKERAASGALRKERSSSLGPDGCGGGPTNSEKKKPFTNSEQRMKALNSSSKSLGSVLASESPHVDQNHSHVHEHQSHLHVRQSHLQQSHTASPLQNHPPQPRTHTTSHLQSHLQSSHLLLATAVPEHRAKHDNSFRREELRHGKLVWRVCVCVCVCVSAARSSGMGGKLVQCVCVYECDMRVCSVRMCVYVCNVCVCKYEYYDMTVCVYEQCVCVV